MNCSSAEWPRFRGANHDGASTETGLSVNWPKEGPPLLWKADVGTGFSSFAVSRGRVYTMGNARADAGAVPSAPAGDPKKTADANTFDTIFCLDANTAKVVWKFAYPCPLDPKYYPGGPSSTPTLDGNSVFTFSKSGHVFCLDAGNGGVLWSRDVCKEEGAKAPQWGFASSPLVAGNSVILNVGTSGIALDKTTGKVLWKSAPEPLGFQGGGPAGYASAIPIGPDRIAVFGFNALRGVNLADGKVVWELPWPTSFGENSSTPVLIAPGKLFVSSSHGRGSSLLLMDGEKITEAWHTEKYGNHIAASVLSQGHAFGFDGRIHKDPGSLNCVKLDSGEVKWTKPGMLGQLVLADGKLIILTLQGMLVLAEASTSEFKELASAQVIGGKCWTPPVLCGGKLFVRNSAGEVRCLRLK